MTGQHPADDRSNGEQSHILNRMKDQGVAYVVWPVC